MTWRKGCCPWGQSGIVTSVTTFVGVMAMSWPASMTRTTTATTRLDITDKWWSGHNLQNSMASQSIVAELAVGDRVQVLYLYSTQSWPRAGVHVHTHRADGQEEQLVHPLHRHVPPAQGLLAIKHPCRHVCPGFHGWHRVFTSGSSAGYRQRSLSRSLSESLSY